MQDPGRTPCTLAPPLPKGPGASSHLHSTVQSAHLRKQVSEVEQLAKIMFPGMTELLASESRKRLQGPCSDLYPMYLGRLL